MSRRPISLTVDPDGKLMRNYREWQDMAGDTADPPDDGVLLFWRAYIDRPWRVLNKPRLNQRQSAALFAGAIILIALSVATITGFLLGVGFKLTRDVAISMYIVYGVYVAWWELAQSSMISRRPTWASWPSFDRLLSKPKGPRGLLLFLAIPFTLAGLGLAYTVSVVALVLIYLTRPLPERGAVRPAWNSTVRLIKAHPFIVSTPAIVVGAGFLTKYGLAAAIMAAGASLALFVATHFVAALISRSTKRRTAQLHAKHQPVLRRLILQVFGNGDLYKWVCEYQGESPAVHFARRSMLDGAKESQGTLMPVELSASQLAEIVRAYAAASSEEPFVSRQVLAETAAATERTWPSYIFWRICQWVSPQITVREKLVPLPIDDRPDDTPRTEAEKEAA